MSEAAEIRTTSAFIRFRRNVGALVGLIVLLVMISLAILAPVVAPFDPLAQDLPNRLGPPSSAHLLGLDQFGRDVLSRIIYGGRVSFQVALAVVAISLTMGSALGVISGYYGGKIDALIMSFVNLLLAFPGIILAIAIMAALGQGIANIVIALIVFNWTGYARVVRGEALAIKEREFIEAMRIMGAKDRTILLRHMLPNAFPPVIVLATLNMGFAILAEAGLSFLGLGVNPPTPSWGSMIANGQIFLLFAPQEAVFSGLAISLTVLSFNLVGDGLRDALDPRLKI